jgi:AcrR family transcriptional regulator
MKATKQERQTRLEPLRDRKEQIVQKALELFVSGGYEQTSVEDITEACNMSKGNFYNYFDSKEDLVYLIREGTVQELNEEIIALEQRLGEVGPTEALRYYFKAYIWTVDKHQNAYNFLNHVVIRLGREGRRKLLQGSIDVQGLFERLLLAGIGKGVFKSVDVKLTAHNIAHLGAAWAHNRWHLRRFLNLDEYTRQQTQFVLDAILAKVASESVAEKS